MLANDLKTGIIFKENGQPFLVMKYEHIKSARGGANVKVKARHLLTGQVLEKSYLASAKMESADVLRKNAQYLYKDTNYVFMDPDTFDQITMNSDVVGDSAVFLKEGESVQVMYFEGNPVSIELPITMIFEITYTEPGFKGNTVSNVYKDAVLDNGASIKVPTFAKIGDKIKIDTRSGTYISKA
ncbi:elongation factor P [candidate division WWE3 bacterium RIFOXYC1_FULL_39_7]|uniref:Elongation factor P n=2 Tax=Katanobacteria TaxID=422282 RepID=A0A1F4X3A5_UNCKA|nr:MAG: elongation factor P [candidate division WWE3 bacterium RIFOXYC1_FULL_39_7]OGC76190.1 MAG: elongation factor P [candidate division WWE3 bacterium RIFOXYD1_FULL_39_9]